MGDSAIAAGSAHPERAIAGAGAGAPPRRRWLRRIAGTIVAAIALLGAAIGLLWISPYSFMSIARAAARWHLGIEERSIVVHDHLWPYLEAGPPEAPPVILLHGYNTSKDAMMTMSSWLAGEHRTVAPDLPGFGLHDFHAEQAHDGSFYAREVLALMDALGIERASLVGTSMGGAIAALVAAEAPERVDRLVLLAPAGLVAPVENDFMKRANAGGNPLRLEDEQDFESVMDLVFEKRPPTPYPVRRFFVLEAQRRLDGTNKIIPAIEPFGRNGLEGRLGAIRAPTLVLWGERDRVLDPSMLSRFVAEIPDAQGHEIPGAGHVLFSDEPAEVRRRMVPFLAPTGAPNAE